MACPYIVNYLRPVSDFKYISCVLNVYLGLAKFDKLYRRLVQLRTMLRNIKNIIINKNNFTVSYNIVVL